MIMFFKYLGARIDAEAEEKLEFSSNDRVFKYYYSKVEYEASVFRAGGWRCMQHPQLSRSWKFPFM